MDVVEEALRLDFFARPVCLNASRADCAPLDGRGILCGSGDHVPVESGEALPHFVAQILPEFSVCSVRSSGCDL